MVQIRVQRYKEMNIYIYIYTHTYIYIIFNTNAKAVLSRRVVFSTNGARFGYACEKNK